MKTKPQKDMYFVAVKIFLTDREGRLFIFKDRFGDWDLPGGRLRTNDFSASFKTVVARKMKQELGAGVRYKLLNTPVILMRHERNEILGKGKREKRRIFAVGYAAQMVSGKISLGENHVKSMWVDPKKFNPKKYLTGGWLEGVEEYIKRAV